MTNELRRRGTNTNDIRSGVPQTLEQKLTGEERIKKIILEKPRPCKIQ